MDFTQPEFRFKLPELLALKTLGQYSQKYNWVTKDFDFFIYADVKRIIDYCRSSILKGWDTGFDQVFSHVICHEYIHYILQIQLGTTENVGFDNLFGVVPYNPKYVYSGVEFEGDPPYRLPKRHFYTKLINTIKDKIGLVK